MDKPQAGWVGTSKSPPKLQNSDIQSKFLGIYIYFLMQARICARCPNIEISLLVPPICKEPRGTTILTLWGIGTLLIRTLLHKWIEKTTQRDARGRCAGSPEEPALISFAEWLCHAHFLQKQPLMWYHLPFRLYISHTTWTLLKY